MSLEEARKQSFGAIAEAYDRYRPSYPPAAHEALGLRSAARVLEIGCGTGQFTSYLTAAGCVIDALDISDEMLTLAKNKFRAVAFHKNAFEDFIAPAGTYDAIVSATAFHWVKAPARTQRTAELLKPGGLLAFLYNRNDYMERRDTLTLAIQAVYERCITGKAENIKMLEEKSEIIAAEIAASPLFCNVEQLSFPNPVTYSTSEYLGVLGTYSYQNTLPPAERVALFDGIAAVIEKHGGSITIPYETILYKAYKK